MIYKKNKHRNALETLSIEHKKDTYIFNSIINDIRWQRDFAHRLRLECLARHIGLSAMEFKHCRPQSSVCRCHIITYGVMCLLKVKSNLNPPFVRLVTVIEPP